MSSMERRKKEAERKRKATRDESEDQKRIRLDRLAENSRKYRASLSKEIRADQNRKYRYDTNYHVL